MKNALFISNKYITGFEHHSNYRYFIESLRAHLIANGYDLTVVFFSDLMKFHLDHDWTLYFRKTNSQFPKTYANEVEKKYRFTFRQAVYPDFLQIFPTQIGRTYYVPEKFLESELKTEPEKFLFLETIFGKKSFDFVFVDQSPESEMEYARSICFNRNIPFLRYTCASLGRTVLHQQTRFGEEKIVERISNDFSFSDAEKWLDFYLLNRRDPYPPAVYNDRFEKIGLIAKIKLYGASAPIKIASYAYRKFIKPILKLETLIKSAYIHDRVDLGTEKFLFYGFHLPTESTVGLRGLPFLNQIMLIEVISRCLPMDHVLYVREHPWWREHFPLQYLLRVKKIPNVRLISPKLSIHDILKNAQGVLTINATTGIEALVYGKPVLSFAANVYSDFHPAALKCENLFLVGEMLARLIDTKVDRNDTIRFIQKLHNNSIPLRPDSFCMTSEADAREKATLLADTLVKARAILRKSRAEVVPNKIEVDNQLAVTYHDDSAKIKIHDDIGV